MAVSGDLREMELTTLISVNCNEGNQARLTLHKEDEDACIYFDAGNIAHMVKGDQEGEEVIHDLLTWEEGSFKLEMDVPPPDYTVDAPWSHLVLSGIQRIDERSADESAEGDHEDDSDFTWEMGLEEEEPLGLDQAFQETSQEHPQEESAPDVTKLNALLERMADEIPGFVSAEVVGMDGLPLAHCAVDSRFDAETLAAQFALVMKLVERTSAQLDAGGVADNLVTTNDTYMMARFLGDDGAYYLGVIVDREGSSLGNVRLLIRNYADDLRAAIPSHHTP
jgi:predicted regulator of Ras-like GTPase activity (Roadblock/LC7/MglB family)